MNPTPYQQNVLRIPETYNLMLAGGRGGGKSVCLLLLVLRFLEKYPKQRALIVRATHKSLLELAENLTTLLAQVYGAKGCKQNKHDGSYKLPNGSVIELGQLEKSGDYNKFQGRSIGLLAVDEAGLIADPRWVQLLKSNLRAAPGTPVREIRCANPAGPAHGDIYHNHITRAPAWTPYTIGDETWVNCPSTMTDNPHIDHAQYERSIRAACKGDADLARAWVEGAWNINRGSYFAGVLDESVHMLRLTHQLELDSFHKFISGDWGSSAPSVYYVCLQSWGGNGFPPGSLILIDELATNEPDDLNKGLNWPVSMLAEGIKDMCSKWSCEPRGVSDTAYGLDETLIQRLDSLGVYVELADKHRVAGWTTMRDMLTNAAQRNGKPGLWVSERCQYFWQTAPFVQRNPRRPEDIRTDGPEHGCDAARYACMHAASWRPMTQSAVVGRY